MSIKKSLAWLGMAQVFVFLSQLAASVVLARYLTPREFGIATVGIATVALLSIVQNVGLQALIVREKVLSEEIKKTCFTINAGICLAVSLATIAASYMTARFLGEPGVRNVLLVLAITPLFGILSFLPASCLERKGEFKRIALVTTTMNLFNAGATMALAVLGFKYMSMAYAGVVSTALLSLMFIVVGRTYFDWRLGLTQWKRVAEFGSQILMVSGITTLSQRSSEILLGRILGLGALGLYNRAGGLNGMLWGNVHWVASRVVLVDFANVHREGLPLRDRYIKTVAIVTATLWPGFAGLALVAKPIIFLVYGERWIPAALPLTYLAIASMILVTLTMTWEVFTVTGNLRIQTRVEAIRAPISIAMFVGGCLISLEAAAISRIIDAGVAYILYRPHLNRITDTRLADFKHIYSQSMLLTLAAIAPAGILTLSMSEGVSSWFTLIAAIVLGGVLWLGSLFALKHPLATELMNTARHRFPRLASRAPIR